MHPAWERYHNWSAALGDLAFPYAQLPYSGLGYLISRNFGVEPTIYAILDYPDEVAHLNEAINRRNLSILDTILDGPFDTLIISDNFDSNIQTKELFDAYSRSYYSEVGKRSPAKGKFLAVIRWRDAWRPYVVAECGVDGGCGNSCTDVLLTPAMARKKLDLTLFFPEDSRTVFGSSGTMGRSIMCTHCWSSDDSPR